MLMHCLKMQVAGFTNKIQNVIDVLDPSDKFRPEHKEKGDFRNYAEGQFIDRVRQCYYNMHTHQGYQFATDKLEHWTKFNHCKMNIMEAVVALDDMVDESDPDIGLPNSVHAFQTAERIREAHPDHDWFHLTGLIHDLGKIMAFHGEPQWATTGDTYPVGCQFAEEIVFGMDSFRNNPDINHPVYSTKLGIYKENCGLTNVRMSWGHDEYMYQVLLHNECHLPEEALNMIRFHSFYPWHTSGCYHYLCDEHDFKMLDWVREFNKFDLYSKSDDTPDVESLKPYYQSLIDKYLPGVLEW